MADFNFYLNRQGVRGRKGDKGDQGFSPVITEYDTGNPLEYVLRIQTEDGVMYTQNLRPEFVNNGGTYLRFNQSNSAFSIGAADYATTSAQGEVRLANASDITNLTSTTTAVTPKDVDTILTNKGYASSISNLQSNVSDLDGDLTSLYGTVTNLSGTVSSLSNTVASNYNNTVKLSGNQSISNTKTFTGQINTNNIYNVTGDRTMIRYYTSTDSLILAGATTQNIYLRTSATGKLIHQKDGAEYEVYDTSNLTAGNNISINNGVISATDTTYTAGRGIDITNSEVSISNIVVDTNSNQTISGDKYFSGSSTFAHLEAESIEINGGEASWLTYNGSGGATLGRSDANHITLPTNSQDLIQVTRGGNTYTNIDSGNIGTYAPIPTITDGTGIDVSVSGNTYTISVDNTVVNTSSIQTISGVKHFTGGITAYSVYTDYITTSDGHDIMYRTGNALYIQNPDNSVRVTLSSTYNRINIRRNNTNYINIDSGNISDYASNDSYVGGEGVEITNLVKLPNNLSSDTGLSTNSAQSSRPAYYAFDGDMGTFWGAQTGDARWISRQHESIVVKRVDLVFKNAAEAMVSGTIQGSNDGSTYTTLGSFTNSAGNSLVSVDCSSNTTAYTYTRLYGSTSGGAWGAVNDIQIYYEGDGTTNTVSADVSSDIVRRIVKLTQAEYDTLLNNDTVDPLALYLIVSSS